MLKEIFSINKEIAELKEETIVDLSDPYTVIHKLREINPKEFEDVVGVFFEMRWYTITHQAKRKKIRWQWKATSDKWIDLIVTKDWMNKYIQIKKLINHQVSSSIVRDFYGTIIDKLKEWDEWIILTTSIFSKDSREFAKNKWIRMIDYVDLLKQIEYLSRTHKSSIESYLNSVTTEDNLKYKKYVKTCRKCYAPLVDRKWMFFGCMNYHFTWCDYRIEV